nr:MAG TPA: hypothetical protein [Bacteriophage sp.]
MLTSTTLCCDVKFCDERRLVDFLSKPYTQTIEKGFKVQ